MKELIEKINNVKKGIEEAEIKKSGKNTFAKFIYLELNDFLPVLNKLMSENGILDIFDFSEDEKVTLTLTDGENGFKYVIKKKETSYYESQSKQIKGIQWLGAETTYFRRYLYMIAFGISEHDAIDAVDNRVNNSEKKNSFVEFMKENKNNLNEEDLNFSRNLLQDKNFNDEEKINIMREKVKEKEVK